MSACRPAPESTGLVPEIVRLPVPSAVSVKSALTAVPPLSLVTILRGVSFGAMSSLVIVQVLSSPTASVTVPFGAQSPPQSGRVAGPVRFAISGVRAGVESP